VNEPPFRVQPALLGWCAILRRFEVATLAEIAKATPEAVRKLLAGDLVRPADGGSYTLRDNARREALAQLRRQRPRDEVDKHAQAFHFFLQRVVQSPAHQQRDEDQCFEHLAALHDLFTEYVEWTAISPFLEAARTVRWRQPGYLRWLAFIAMRTGALNEGIAGLEALLMQPDLEPALRMRALHASAIAYSDIPRYGDSLRLLDLAYRLAEAQGDIFRQGYVLLTIGMIYNDLDDHARALEYSERSLLCFQQIGAVYREAHALYEVANNAMREGDWDRARVTLAESAALYTQLQVTNRLSMISWAQGMVYQMLGDDAQSEEAYRRALAVAHTPTVVIPSIAMDSFAGLGLLYQVQGHYDEAQAAYEQAIHLAEQHKIQHRRPIFLYRLGQLLSRTGRTAEAEAAYRKAIDNVEHLGSQPESEPIKISLLGTTASLYESMVLFCLEHATSELAFEYMERSRARAFLDILDQQVPTLYDAFDQPTVTLREVQASLAPGEVVLEYFTTGVLPVGNHWLTKIPPHNQRLRQHVTPLAQIIVFAVTRDTLEVRRVEVDPNKLRPSTHSDDPVLHMLRIDGTARWLYTRLVEPVEQMLAGCWQLYLIPHGPLHYIPFTALRAADGSYLLKDGGPAIALAPSATVLLRKRHRRVPSRAGHSLAIGYNHQEGIALEHAETEARLVAELLGGDCWVGPEAKSDRLIAVGPQLRWLHIAGHAAYHHQAALTSSLRLGASDTLDASTIMRSLKLDADLVTLSSCMSGFAQVVPGDELLGLQRAFLYAGTPTIVCTLAKTRDTVAVLVMEQFYTRLLAGMTAAAALRDALVAVRTMTRDEVINALHRLGYVDTPDISGATASVMTEQDARGCPFAKPEYWAPFVLIGRP
jgi:CHAT domain-containing protein/tetratricopeptide (TPR) repeat protein